MQPTEDERVIAALSHASIVANIVNLAGLILTALIWTMQRERSRYVGMHALQALAYQAITLLLSMFLFLSWGVCLGLSLLPAILRPELFRASPPDAFWLALAGLLVPVGFAVAVMLYGLYGAWQTYHGRPFRYPLAGRLAARVSPTLAGAAPAPADAAPAVADAAPESPAPADAAAPAVADAAPDDAAAPDVRPTVRRRSRRRPPGGAA